MSVYEVKLVNKTHGITVKQRINAYDADEALRLVVKQQNDFLGVDYDPELDPETIVIVSKLVHTPPQKLRSYNVVFHYSMEVEAYSEEEAEDIAWDIFHEETDSGNFVATVEEK